MDALFDDNPHIEPLARHATTRHGVSFKNKDHAHTRTRPNVSALAEIGDEGLGEDEVLVDRRGSRVIDLEQGNSSTNSRRLDYEYRSIPSAPSIEEELAMKKMAAKEKRSEADSKADVEKDGRMLKRVELELEKTRIQAEAEMAVRELIAEN
ncbi:hypothetical protein BGX27_004153 [Mortierella sp. AM989]|nr:hypothetical protein BGX27_004153 [Mortierella sp. AM989]